VKQRVLLLIAGTALFWVLSAIPVRHLGGGELTLLYSATSLLLCLLPAVATLVWLDATARKDPSQVLLVVLGATGVRMFFVLVAGILLLFTVPLYREQSGFLMWLLVSYLFTLALEMTLLLKGWSRPDGSL
jgi:hypothetical protein